jgi:serine/threonine protein kinase
VRDRRRGRGRSVEDEADAPTEVEGAARMPTASMMIELEDDPAGDEDKPIAPSQPDASLPEPQVGDCLHGRYTYRLERRLGSGGFGSVYLASCLQSSRSTASETDRPPDEVAVKVLGKADDPLAASSLKRELAALRAIQSRNIPKLYDWSLDGDTAFSVVQYYPGGSLADARPLIGQLEEEQTWRLMSDLLTALNAAHRASILHLDVKPSNVLLDGQGGYVLTDFGVSHASRMSRGLLHQGQIAVGLGTHGFRAPEQDSRAVQSFDLRTDLWGVGATAWSLYTGIDLNKRADVLRKREEGNIFGLRRLSDVRISCPPPLEEVVMGLLYIDPSKRPGGAGEVLTHIRAVASGFGLDAQTVVASRRESADAGEIQGVINSLVDPLWASICRAPGFDRYFAKFEDGEVLSDLGETAHHTFLLLKGAIRIERNGELVDVEDREGALMGAISTLTGAPRTVTMRAQGPVWICVFNEAELEQLVTCNSSVAVRMIRTMATRISDGPPRRSRGGQRKGD